MPKTPDELANTMIANFKEKTGKTLEQWIAIARKSGASRHSDILKLLKNDHAMTHGFANLVALKTLKSDAASIAESTDLVAAQYAGEKAVLKPIYDAVIAAAKSCGAIEVAPKKAYVSLRRAKQFAIIQPSTRTRVDLGLNIKGAQVTQRLEKSGSFNAMVSHRVRLEKASDVDREVKAWLKKAWSDA